nr:AlpA family phage regulatory protein [Rhizobacter sp. Root16D2]
MQLPECIDAAFTSLSESTVEKLVREEAFPKPRLLSGRRVAWLVREVTAWCEERPVSNLLPPPFTGRRKTALAPQAHRGA